MATSMFTRCLQPAACPNDSPTIPEQTAWLDGLQTASRCCSCHKEIVTLAVLRGFSRWRSTEYSPLKCRYPWATKALTRPMAGAWLTLLFRAPLAPGNGIEAG